ncbi:MAG: glycosyltransferase [Myxococcota bacterium]|nr:glycosyltransferase [Myxococcota bacterium]
MLRIFLVVPCYNEAERLDLQAFRNARLKRHRLEFVFVDDGSKDGTRGILDGLWRERPEEVHVIAHDQNQGKAEAVRRGVMNALSHSPDAIGFWDADLATPLSELASFVDILDSHPATDMVFGSRVKLMGRTIHRRPWRHYVGRVFATAASIAIGLPVYDTQCGAKLFRATPLLGTVFEQPFATRWIFDVEILARFMALDPRGADHVARSLYELPLRTWTDVRGSKLKAVDFAKAAIDLAVIRAKYPRRVRQSGSRS